VFVTSQGSAYSHFKRALERGNFLLAWTLAAELPKVPLADALALLLLALDQQPWRFETAAPRWHARLCDEARLTIAEAQLALAALQTLSGPGAVGGGQALARSAARTVSMMPSGSSKPGWTPTTEATSGARLERRRVAVPDAGVGLDLGGQLLVIPLAAQFAGPMRRSSSPHAASSGLALPGPASPRPREKQQSRPAHLVSESAQRMPTPR
jgi:hypothetical protein